MPWGIKKQRPCTWQSPRIGQFQVPPADDVARNQDLDFFPPRNMSCPLDPKQIPQVAKHRTQA